MQLLKTRRKKTHTNEPMRSFNGWTVRGISSSSSTWQWSRNCEPSCSSQVPSMTVQEEKKCSHPVAHPRRNQWPIQDSCSAETTIALITGLIKRQSASSKTARNKLPQKGNKQTKNNRTFTHHHGSFVQWSSLDDIRFEPLHVSLLTPSLSPFHS